LKKKAVLNSSRYFLRTVNELEEMVVENYIQLKKIKASQQQLHI